MLERIDRQHDSIILPVDGIKLKSNSAYTDIELAHGSGQWQQDLQDSNFGTLYRQSLSFSMPMERPELADWFNRYREMRFISIIEDRNLFVRVLGTKDNPLKFSNITTTTSSNNGKNGRTISFVSDSIDEALILDAADNSFEIAGTPISMHGTGAIGNQTYQLIMQLRNGAGFLRYRHFFFDETELTITKDIHGLSEVLSVLLLRLDGYQIYTEIKVPIYTTDIDQTVRVRFNSPVSGLLILS
jgi:hypothetical protein